MNLLLLTHITH